MTHPSAFLPSLSSKFRFLIVLVVLINLFATSVAAKNNDAVVQQFELPPLPYAYDALEPMISSKTLNYHHDKHHAKYVNTMNSMLAAAENDELKSLTALEDIILYAHQKGNVGLFNNAAQSWNHEFYWNCMTSPKNGGGEPPKQSHVSKLIQSSFGSHDEFVKQFTNAGNTAFGSGWAWLCYTSTPDNNKKLFVTKTIGAGTPLTDNDNGVVVPILTMDVWEHAYYLDYQNARPTYTETFLNKLVNWDFVESNLKKAMKMNDDKGEEL